MNRNLRRAILVLAGMLVLSAPAEAQFNLGGKIKNVVKSSAKKVTDKAKNTVSTQVDKIKNAPAEIVSHELGKAEVAAERAMDDAVTKVKKTAEKKVKEGAKKLKDKALYDRTYKPSKKAKKNDPKTADETTPDGHTRTVAQIHAGYEHLPKAYCSPYYENSNWYRMDTEESNNFHNNMRLKVFQAAYKFKNESPIGQYIYAFGDSGDAVPAGYHTIWANMARFASDLKGVTPVAYFLNAKVMLTKFIFGGVQMGKNSSDKMVNSDIYLIDTPANLTRAASDEMERLEELLYSITPYDVLFQATERMMNGIDNNLSSNPINAAAYFDCAKQGLEYLEAHPGNPKDDAYEQLTRRFNKYDANRVSIMEDAQAASYGKQAMPATVKVDSKTQNAVLAAVKKKFPNMGIQKVVFFDKDWTNAKSQEWPYKIVQRSKLIGVLYKKGNDWILEKFEMIQDTSNNGKTWSKTYRFIGEGGPRIVDYK